MTQLSLKLHIHSFNDCIFFKIKKKLNSDILFSNAFSNND